MFRMGGKRTLEESTLAWDATLMNDPVGTVWWILIQLSPAFLAAMIIAVLAHIVLHQKWLTISVGGAVLVCGIVALLIYGGLPALA